MVWLACLSALPAQDTAAKRLDGLVRWLEARSGDDQYTVFVEYRNLLLATEKRSWIGDLDPAMREFGSAKAAALPEAAVALLLDDVAALRARSESLQPYLPWLLLVAQRRPQELRAHWSVLEAMAAPGRTLDTECSREHAVVVLTALEAEAKNAAIGLRREQLLAWLPELAGFGDAEQQLAFLRAVVERRVEHLKNGESIAPGALRLARLDQLAEQFVAAVRDAKGDPFAVIELMRRMAPDDVTNDLLYVLLHGSAGRQGDSEIQKASRKRFDEAWKAREKSGLDVEAMKRRLAAVGVKQACEDLGLGFDPGGMSKAVKEQRELLFPTSKGLDVAAESAAKPARDLEAKMKSISSSIERYTKAADNDAALAKNWRKRAARAGNKNDKLHFTEEAINKERSAKSAGDAADSKQTELEELKSELRTIQGGNRVFDVRRRNLFGN